MPLTKAPKIYLPGQVNRTDGLCLNISHIQLTNDHFIEANATLAGKETAYLLPYQIYLCCEAMIRHILFRD